MRFNDRISLPSDGGLAPFNGVAALTTMEARLVELCFILTHASRFGICILEAAKSLQREVKAMIHTAMMAHRQTVKLDMLRRPAWRMRVIKDLGGIEKLFRLWHRRSQPFIPMTRQIRHLSPEEIRRRAHIKLCAKACAHPLIKRDPFRVDIEGRFRLPPLPRQSRDTGSPSDAQNEGRDYAYDARPVNDFTGLKAPIMVWPEEFILFMQMEREAACRGETGSACPAKPRYGFAQKWGDIFRIERFDTPPLLLGERAKWGAPKFVRAPPVLMGEFKNETACRGLQAAKSAG